MLKRLLFILMLVAVCSMGCNREAARQRAEQDAAWKEFRGALIAMKACVKETTRENFNQRRHEFEAYYEANQSVLDPIGEKFQLDVSRLKLFMAACDLCWVTDTKLRHHLDPNVPQEKAIIELIGGGDATISARDYIKLALAKIDSQCDVLIAYRK